MTTKMAITDTHGRLFLYTKSAEVVCRTSGGYSVDREARDQKSLYGRDLMAWEPQSVQAPLDDAERAQRCMDAIMAGNTTDPVQARKWLEDWCAQDGVPLPTYGAGVPATMAAMPAIPPAATEPVKGEQFYVFIVPLGTIHDVSKNKSAAQPFDIEERGTTQYALWDFIRHMNSNGKHVLGWATREDNPYMKNATVKHLPGWTAGTNSANSNTIANALQLAIRQGKAKQINSFHAQEILDVWVQRRGLVLDGATSVDVNVLAPDVNVHTGKRVKVPDVPPEVWNTKPINAQAAWDAVLALVGDSKRIKTPRE